ncbi:MAG TPA: restriction endonuclease subunit S [Haliscomenobacter sp.]|uniref:restriction endonuclease subunit S n=1 Tax=Haliscomenobacter sp. TaxID=2717303 RepID=UPI002CB63112|nr:restriction endonuclease subunit S [Haliscomenobacter sp.]HOY20718.1 restriction endonuclease subunit S [Haliscomenobacter sp.]
MRWKTINLAELVENFSVRAKDHSSDTSALEFCGVSNEDGITKSKYAAEDKAEDYKIIEKDCFAYNPYRINVGSIGLIENEIVGLISPAYVVFKPKPRSILPQLLLKFLKSTEGLRQIKMYARGTVRQALRFEDLCKIEITIPEYDEQNEVLKRILDTEIEKKALSSELTHQLSLVKQLRQAFLREAMQGKLVAQAPQDEPAAQLLAKIKAEKKSKRDKDLPPITEDEVPFNIPNNWVWCRLGEITSLITSGSRNWNKFYSNEGSIFIRSQNIKATSIDLNRLAFVNLPVSAEGQRTAVQNRDILITITGAGVSNCAILKDVDLDEAYVSQHISLVRLIYPEIAEWCHRGIISESIGKRQFAELIYGDKPGLNLNQISNLLIPLPPLAEQERIVAKLDELMRYCDALEASIQASRVQNEGLLQQVLREALAPGNGA